MGLEFWRWPWHSKLPKGIQRFRKDRYLVTVVCCCLGRVRASLALVVTCCPGHSIQPYCWVSVVYQVLFQTYNHHRECLCSVPGTVFSPCQCLSQRRTAVFPAHSCGGWSSWSLLHEGPVCVVPLSSPQGGLSLARAQVWLAGTVP